MLRIKPPKSRTSRNVTLRSPEELLAKANEFLEKSNLAAAFPLLTQLADLRPEDSQTQMVTGLVAMGLGDKSAAAAHLERALSTAPDDFDANYNMAMLQMMNGNLGTALDHLKHLRRLHPENASLLNDIAIIWANRKHRARALGTYARALRLDPNDGKTRNNAMQFCLEQELWKPGRKLLGRQEQSDRLTPQSEAEIRRWKEIIAQAELQKTETASEDHLMSVSSANEVTPLKIAFFANHRTFIGDIMQSLSVDHEVRLFEGDKAEQMQELMSWADMAWFEWCDNLIIEATRLPKLCRIICRLHSYEAFTDMPSRVDWEKVDHLVFVNQSVAELCRPQIEAAVPTSVIHNGVDLERFVIPDERLSSPGPVSKKIASVGYINYKKNPALLLYCFKKIYQYDQEYSLHIAGSHQDPRIRLYVDHFLRQNRLPVHFDGWVEDMPAWYADKGYVISTSLFESFHYSIAEGMASGLLPVIHSWYGAEYIYPQEYLFNDPDSCLDLLKRLETADRQQLIQTNREYIARRYSQADKLSEISDLIQSVTTHVTQELR